MEKGIPAMAFWRKTRLQTVQTVTRWRDGVSSLAQDLVAVFGGLLCALVVVSRVGNVEGAEPGKPRPDIVGWFYSDVANVPIIILVKVWRDADGHLRGSTDNLARGETNHVASSVFYDYPNFRLETDWSDDFLKGTLSEDGNKLDVTYQAGDFAIGMVLKRIDPASVPTLPELSYLPSTAEGPGAFAGYWNGEVELLNAKVRHVLRLGRKEDGTLLGRVDMIESGERGVPFTRLEIKGREARFECKPMELVYTGRLTEDGKRLEMKLERGQVTAAVVFQRADTPWKFEEPQPGLTGPPQARALEGEWVGTVDRQSTFWRSSMRFGLDAAGQIRARYRPAVDEPEGCRCSPQTSALKGRNSSLNGWALFGRSAKSLCAPPLTRSSRESAVSSMRMEVLPPLSSNASGKRPPGKPPTADPHYEIPCHWDKANHPPEVPWPRPARDAVFLSRRCSGPKSTSRGVTL